MGLVIDACILRSASKAGKPLPSACRAILEEVKSSLTVVSACPTLMAEWHKHRSNYSRMWLVAMYSRRLIKPVNKFSGKAESIDAAISRLNEPDRTVASKDAHLLKIAIDGNKRVVSSEQCCKRAFSLASNNYSEIAKIAWIDPSEAGDPCRVAIGALPPPREWLLVEIDRTEKETGSVSTL